MGERRTPEVVVVTGASAGVGRAVVREFARHGARIGLLARGRDGLEAAQREVEAAGGAALVLPTDVSDPDQVEAAAEAVELEFGPIDIWINNATVAVLSPVWDMRPEEYRRVTEVAYLGYVHGTLTALKRMRPRDRGLIVQVGSAVAYRGIPLQSAYSGAKHAVKGFTESVRCELLHEKSGVRITTINLPALNTPIHDWSKSRMPWRARPIPPLFQPEVAARAIFEAAHHDRREWNLGAMTKLAVFCNAIIPGLADWYLGRRGFALQMSGEAEDPDRENNLWEPLPGDRGPRGRFVGRACARSWQWWFTTRRRWLIWGAIVAAVLIGAALRAGAY